MKHSIRKRIGIVAFGVQILLVVISFVVSFGCVSLVGAKYRESIANAVLDFAEMTVDADSAKDSFTTRIRAADFDAVQQKLSAYQEQNSSLVDRISLVNFGESVGRYIYDTGDAALGDRLDYDTFTSSVKAELVNGRNAFIHYEQGRLIAYRPIRTVEDTICGYLVVELHTSAEFTYFPYIAAIFAVLLVVGGMLTFLLTLYLNRKLFDPIQHITDSAVYLSGDDSASAGKDTSVIFDTERSDEVGQLSKTLQKILFKVNTGAEHLSQALYDANHDGMTQHLNKRCYHSMVEKFSKCSSICVIYFDVNNLKLMNDTLGHENGDRVIKRAADYIRSFMEEDDYCFRMGGDEFLMVMENCTLRRADHVMQRLNQEEPYLLSREDDSVQCALSYGCAFAKDSFVYDELLTEAEENMYQKKTELKNLLQMPER